MEWYLGKFYVENVVNMLKTVNDGTHFQWMQNRWTKWAHHKNQVTNCHHTISQSTISHKFQFKIGLKDMVGVNIFG